nr:ester hydrolase C11orf54 homolog [Ciona intestinalis]|eukprot:XP_002131943.1 ester hydrolase C11orf54 homolog [Ciona intestinalis]
MKGNIKREMLVENVALHVPSMEELAEVVGVGLKKNYKEWSCSVVDCPDLSKAPFGLASNGICGRTRLVDVGGVPNLVPVSQYMEKVYNLQDISERVGTPGCFILGAGAGSKHVVGCNCELMPNFRCEGGERERVNLCHVARVKSDGGYLLQNYENDHGSSSEFSLLANLFCSDGKQGKVLEVRGKCRIGEKDLVGCMRGALKEHFGPNRPIGMGGTFLVNKGKIKIHVMPDFSETPLTSDNDVNNWLKFYEVTSPFMCLSTFITEDCGLDLRVEHTHGYNANSGVGGHYHYDVTPDEVEYIGYFTPAEFIYRVDRPSTTHNIGRD